MTAARDIPPIKDAVYGLTPADGNPSSRANLQFVLFYQTPDPIPAPQRTTLRQTYFQMLAHYPIFHGHLTRHPATGTASISVTPLSRATLAPSYTEHIVSRTVQDIAKAKYHWDAWPAQLLGVPVVRRGTHELPLAQCVVTWHPDGLGILFSVDHSVADGVGVDILLRQWASLARDGRLACPVDFDHEAVYRELEHVVPQEDHWFVRMVDEVDITCDEPAETAECSAILDSDPRTPRQVEEALRRNMHCFTMTPQQLHRLQAANGGGSAIRLAYALFWQRHMHALRAAPEEPTLINIIHSTRPLISHPHYIGNAVCPVYVRLPAHRLAALPLAQVAGEIGRHMHVHTKEAWVALLRMMQREESYIKFLKVFGNPGAKQMSLSNISRLGFFDTEFGFGPPMFVSVYPALVPGFATWLPLGADGGLRVLWNVEREVFERLANDRVLAEYVDVLF